MKKTIFLTLLSFYLSNAQIQISNFTFNTVQNSGPGQLQEINNNILFPATNDGAGRELWVSDGTPINTNLVVDIATGIDDGIVVFYSTKLNNELFFVANNNYDFSGGEIWRTDGTSPNSVLVADYNGRIYGLTAVGDLVYFTIKQASNLPLQIWKTDGTSLGTELVKEIASYSIPTFQGSVNNKFIFTVQVPSTNNSKVWCSDGTESGTYELTGELDGNGSGFSGTNALTQYINFDNKLYFITRYFLYETDGTISGTNQIASVWNANNDLVTFSDVAELNGNLYFSFFSKDLKKLSIYKSNGTQNGTSLVYTVTSNEYFYPSYLNTLGNNLIFTSINSNNGISLFYLNSDSNIVSEFIEIDQSYQEPTGFLGPLSALSIDKLNNDFHFISSPKFEWAQKKGWILDESTLTLTPFEVLDNLYHELGQKIVYNNELYFSKNYQLWKFDTNSLSINSFEDNQEIKIFPNPSSEFIYFTQSNLISGITIYDLNGKLILKEDMFSNSKINVKGLNSGIYIIKIRDKNDNSTYKKLIKE